MSKKASTPKISADQVRGRIASLESELGTLEREHATEAQAFQEKVAARQKRHAELTGSITSLRALLG